MHTVKKILVCGHKSYAALGLVQLLEDSGYMVDCFSRGPEGKDGQFISGSIMGISKNKYLATDYDIVINFILVKNGSVEENIEYLKELYEFCEQRNVKSLFQVSSVSVYKNDASYISEASLIESNPDNKGAYAAVKVGSDLYLSERQSSGKCQVVFLRPGFIISEEISSPFAGIAKLLPFNFCILLGNKKTSLPFINRKDFHVKIAKILKVGTFNTVYLFVQNAADTKYSYVKMISDRKVIPLPKSLVLFTAGVLKFLKIFNESQMRQIQGLFKVNHYKVENNV